MSTSTATSQQPSASFVTPSSSQSSSRSVNPSTSPQSSTQPSASSTTLPAALTFDLVNTPATETIRYVSHYLRRIISVNDSTANSATTQLTRFHARTIPTIDVLGYLSRILKYAPCGNECFIAVLIYLERMADPNSEVNSGSQMTPFVKMERSRVKRQPVVVNSYNVHRLLISGIMVAVKFLSDIFFTNAHISRVGGLPVQELNQLELEFLLLNDFTLTVSIEDLQACGNRVVASVMRDQSINDALRQHLYITAPGGGRGGGSDGGDGGSGSPAGGSSNAAKADSSSSRPTVSDSSGKSVGGGKG
ncbi:cyclin-domain-containing protein [Cladochytrium replicatum]|nr:cyclin-domain-containing protein [Cladochytrium replicatum]